VWTDFAYGRNTVYAHGHPRQRDPQPLPDPLAENEDVTLNRREGRGLLHCEIDVPGAALSAALHLGSLALTSAAGASRFGALIERLHASGPKRAPRCRGHFNDWRNLAGKRLAVRSICARRSPTDGAGPRAASQRVFRCCAWTHLRARARGRAPPRPHAAGRGRRISDHAPLSAHLRLE